MLTEAREVAGQLWLGKSLVNVINLQKEVAPFQLQPFPEGVPGGNKYGETKRNKI